MKGIVLFGLCLLALSGLSQESEFLLKGRVLDPLGIPVENAYIINIRDLSAYSSRDNGRFNIWVMPGDSLIVNHISFLRKKVYADSVRKFQNIVLEFDTVMIKQVDVGTDPEKLNKYLNKTVKQIKNAEIIIYKRMNPEAGKVNTMAMENNSVLRTEASSVSLVRFSPADLVGLIVNDKRKKRKKKGFMFYRNDKQKLRKEKKKAAKE